jgi:hypothetical protein
VTGNATRTVVEVVDRGVAVATVRIEGSLPGLFVVDALARLAVAARRVGLSVRVPEAGADLRELAAFAGLADALALEERRQPEGREDAGVEEVVQPDEPPA